MPVVCSAELILTSLWAIWSWVGVWPCGIVVSYCFEFVGIINNGGAGRYQKEIIKKFKMFLFRLSDKNRGPYKVICSWEYGKGENAQYIQCRPSIMF